MIVLAMLFFLCCIFANALADCVGNSISSMVKITQLNWTVKHFIFTTAKSKFLAFFIIG